MEELRLRDVCVLVQSISVGFTVGIVPRDRTVGRVCNILDIDQFPCLSLLIVRVKPKRSFAKGCCFLIHP